VLGDVGQPGIKTMTRRLSVYEALAEAGGVLDTGDKKKVVILRRQADGNVRAIPVNVRAIEQGKAKEMAYLVPGDQVIVPGNKWKTFDKVFKLVPILNFARIFGLPF
jgi:protein involved in polysaccharide export with SLBB domain